MLLIVILIVCFFLLCVVGDAVIPAKTTFKLFEVSSFPLSQTLTVQRPHPVCVYSASLLLDLLHRARAMQR